MVSYLKVATPNVKSTPQMQPIPGRNDQVQNSEGGYVFAVDKWTVLDRFIFLGTEKGSFYSTQQNLTRQNTDSIQKLIKEDGVRVVNRVKEISVAGRAPKQDNGIFVLALCASFGDLETRQAAFKAMPEVCRTATTLFMFVDFCVGD